MKCPDKCSGGDASRQRDLSPGEKHQIPEAIAAKATSRCSYCGCVYDGNGLVYGTLNNDILGEGWHPRS